MKKCLIILTVLFSAFSLFAAKYTPCETYYNDSVTVLHFLPNGLAGIFDPGQPISLAMSLKAKADGKADIKLTVTDYLGKNAGNQTLTIDLKAGKTTRTKIELTAPGANGHFTVDAEITVDGKKSAEVQSAYAVIPPPPAEADPFFNIDGKNPSYLCDLTGMFKRIGVGSIQLGSRNYKNESYERAIQYFYTNKPKAEFQNIIGYIYSNFAEPKLKDRLSGYPYAEEAYEKYRAGVKAIATLAKKDITVWIVGAEIDAAYSTASAEDAPSVLNHHIRAVKIAAEELRKANPANKIALLTSCGDDFFYKKFAVSKQVMNAAKDSFDYLAIDAYNGNWSALLGPLQMPEPKFKQLLLGTQELAGEFAKPTDFLINAERGFFCPYFASFKDQAAHDQANFNARSLIINRAIPAYKYYAMHGGCAWSKPYDIKDPATAIDNGMWKSVYNDQKQFAFMPRPSCCAYATVASHLDFVDQAREVLPAQNIYSYIFRKGDQDVVTIWTIGTPERITVQLPAPTVFCDLMGNRSDLQAGKHTFLLTQAPAFLTLKAGADALEKMVKDAAFPDIVELSATTRRAGFDTVDLWLKNRTGKPLAIKLSASGDKDIIAGMPASVELKGNETQKIPVSIKNVGEGKLVIIAASAAQTREIPVSLGYLTIASGKTPAKIVTLKYPDDIYPKEALRPERHLFREDGTNITVDFGASWDSENIYLNFVVNDKTHIQRQHGSVIWRDDSIQFCFDARNDALPYEITGKRGLDANDYLCGIALTDKGPTFYAWHMGRETTGSACSFPTTIKRENGTTVYNTAVPWSVFEGNIKPQPGAAFGFSFIVFDNNDERQSDAPYWVGFTEGVAGGQDPSKYKTVLLSK